MIQIKKTIIELGLDTPAEFWTMDDASLALIMGGCGPGKIGDYFVPDTVWGLEIKAACAVHDLDYELGRDKKKADMRFLMNMLKIINTKTRSKVLRVLRRIRAVDYYSAVAECGNGSFKTKA